jgi:hypothetical protein
MPEVAPRPSPDEDTFQRGLMIGREATENAIRKIGAWAEENPGQLVLAGLAFGFVLGKILLRRPRMVSGLEE